MTTYREFCEGIERYISQGDYAQFKAYTRKHRNRFNVPLPFLMVADLRFLNHVYAMNPTRADWWVNDAAFRKCRATKVWYIARFSH